VKAGGTPFGSKGLNDIPNPGFVILLLVTHYDMIARSVERKKGRLLKINTYL
jgi:hypothetical protein